MPANVKTQKGDTEITFGLRAALAVFARRPDDIVRVGYARGAHKDVEPLVRWAKARHVPANELAEADIERVAQSPQHEGLVLAARPRAWLAPQELADTLAHTRGRAIALDRVRNPYNVGAILRTAAFFGLDAVLLGAPAPHPGLAPNAVRVAEGGAEHVALARTTDLADTLARMKAQGVRVVGADGAANKTARDADFSPPCVLVMGNEREGMIARVRGQCDEVVAIAGTGAVESLNVAVAASVLIAQMAGAIR